MPEEWEIPDDELNELIGDIVHPKAMSLEQALRSADPLGNFNNNLPERTRAQKEFRLLYAAILETNSVGVSVLFDHFSRPQTAAIRLGYERLGARKLCAAMDAVKTSLQRHLGKAPAKAKIRALLDDSPPEINAIDRKTRGIVAEMEKALLRHARENIPELKE